MTPEKQRIAIAKACGWTELREEEIESVDFDSRSVSVYFGWRGWRGFHPSLGSRKWLPDYLKDLNAMHEAEKMLTDEQQCARLARELAILVKGFAHDPFLGVSSYIWHATAAQRAEAFLRTIGKWEESP